MITAAQWLRLLCTCDVKFTTAAQWCKVFETRVQAEMFSVGFREMDDFVGQILHETQMLTALVENLNYSAKRLTEVWPSRFPTLDSAAPFSHNQMALAEKVYGGRLGNTKPGQGFRYRGRGIPMITGYANYELLQRLTGVPLLDNPEILADPDTAMRVGILWWEKKVPDSAIDSIEKISRAVNGGLVGLPDRKALTEKAGIALRGLGAV